MLKIARLRGVLGPCGSLRRPQPHEAAHRDGDAPAAAERQVGAHPVEPSPDVVRGPVRTDLGGQAQVRFLEEVFGHLAIAGRPNEEREEPPVVVGPGGHDQRVRLRDAMCTHSVDGFEGGGHRFHAR